MKTTHKILFENANDMKEIPNETIDLMVTSPPYPMIQMWDAIFSNQNPDIKDALDAKDGKQAFELMNRELDKVWSEVYRVLKVGGFACINIGDATRKIDTEFQLYSNHSRILTYCRNIGFTVLPEILWRKQTNAPNKFMGSGMLPSGAYVTLEHEYILILRKGGKKSFKTNEDKLNRHKSAFFWEERNSWFSDVWEGLKGTKQNNIDPEIRERSGAFPYELAYRIINMYSAKRDTVLDPFLGTGTTTIAAMASGRNSIGIEIDPNFKGTISSRFEEIAIFSNKYINARLDKHLDFVTERTKTKGELKYENKVYGFPVMTRQELELVFNELQKITKIDDSTYEVTYVIHPNETTAVKKAKSRKNIKKAPIQEEKEPIEIENLSIEEEKMVEEIIKKYNGLVTRNGAIKMIKMNQK